MKFIERIRPNLTIGMLCLMVLALAAAFKLPPAELKEVILFLGGGIVGTLTNLLQADQPARQRGRPPAD